MKKIVICMPWRVTPRQIRRGTVPKSIRPTKRNKGKVIFVMFGAPSPRHIVVVKYPDDIDGQISLNKDVVYKMNHSSWVVPGDVKPSLTDVATANGKVDTASTLAKTRAVGTAEARLALLGDAKTLIKELATGYVQQLADSNPGHEKEIAQSCGLDTKIKGGRQPNIDSVAATGIDGEVEIQGKSKKNSTIIHEWNTTVNRDDPRSWYLFPISPTRKAHKLVGGLPINVDLFFRHRIIIDDIPQEWGQVLQIKLTH